MSINNASDEPPVEKLRMIELGRLSRIIMELEPLADIYERHGTGTFKLCSELLAECRALEKDLLDNAQRKLQLSDVFRRTFTGNFRGTRKALLEMGPDDDS